MSDRDVERDTTPASFAATLRRIADAVEAGESFRIQVVNKRFTVPANASLSVEHEAEDGEHELELQLKWTAEDDD
jgi:amphi-Trp domain-containing protein